MPLAKLLAESSKLLEETKGSSQKDLIIQMKMLYGAAHQLFNLINRPGKFETEMLLKASREDTEKRSAMKAEELRKRRSHQGAILIVDDNKAFRYLLSMSLEHQGYEVAQAENGETGFWTAQTRKVDLILLDIALPGMNGYELLKLLKADIVLRNIPVIILSGVDETQAIVKWIEMGAEDYVPKTFNPVLLQARIEAFMEKKRLRDVEMSYLTQLQAEQEKSERLLLNILPKAIADRLKRGESTIVDSFPDVTVLFADLVGFTALSTRLSPGDLVQLLNEIFSAFDRLSQLHGLEKIKTIGDAYMVVGGLPIPRTDHAEAMAEMALDMQSEIDRINNQNKTSLNIRIGINTGQVIAGIIGKFKFSYDLWGDTVNIASRMESHGFPSCIQVTPVTHDRLKEKYMFERGDQIVVKGKGEMTTYFLMGRKLQN